MRLPGGKVGEQAQRKNQAEQRTPTHIENLVARLVDVSCEPVDQIDQAETS